MTEENLLLWQSGTLPIKYYNPQFDINYSNQGMQVESGTPGFL